MYNVCFEYTEKAGGYAGVRTWTSFKSKEDWDAKKEALLANGKERVIAEGVSDEESIEITRKTPLICYFRAQLQEMAEMFGPKILPCKQGSKDE